MAERIEEFTPRSNHTWSKYPWEQWTDGSIWRIAPGEDFDSTHSTMRSVLYQRARLIGMRVRVRLAANPAPTDVIEFQFTERSA